MIVIGSTALEIGFEDTGMVLGRKPVDLDLMGWQWEINDFIANRNVKITKKTTDKTVGTIDSRHVEFEILNHSFSGQLCFEYLQKYKTPKREKFYNVDMAVAPLEVMYSIKKSHRHFPRNWKKHIVDFLKMDVYLNGIDVLDRITAVREEETKKRVGLKTPSLNKNAKDFFDDNVSNRTFVHDDIHKVMAHFDKPMYEYIKVDPNLVKCSREKFEALSFTQKMCCVLEEAYVIALERAIIPMIFCGGPITTADDAFDWAIMRICTNLTSGWFREFATMRYLDIMNYRNENYVDKFLNAVDNGTIKRIETKNEPTISN